MVTYTAMPAGNIEAALVAVCVECYSGIDCLVGKFLVECCEEP
jgi:hypothetical protein